MLRSFCSAVLSGVVREALGDCMRDEMRRRRCRVSTPDALLLLVSQRAACAAGLTGLPEGNADFKGFLVLHVVFNSALNTRLTLPEGDLR